MNPHLAVPSPCLSTMVYSLQLSSVFHSVIKILMIHESTVHILLLTLDGAFSYRVGYCSHVAV